VSGAGDQRSSEKSVQEGLRPEKKVWPREGQGPRGDGGSGARGGPRLGQIRDRSLDSRKEARWDWGPEMRRVSAA
jgi:hypothetical protein